MNDAEARGRWVTFCHAKIFMYCWWPARREFHELCKSELVSSWVSIDRGGGGEPYFGLGGLKTCGRYETCRCKGTERCVCVCVYGWWSVTAWPFNIIHINTLITGLSFPRHGESAVTLQVSGRGSRWNDGWCFVHRWNETFTERLDGWDLDALSRYSQTVLVPRWPIRPCTEGGASRVKNVLVTGVFVCTVCRVLTVI